MRSQASAVEAEVNEAADAVAAGTDAAAQGERDEAVTTIVRLLAQVVALGLPAYVAHPSKRKAYILPAPNASFDARCPIKAAEAEGGHGGAARLCALADNDGNAPLHNAVASVPKLTTSPRLVELLLSFGILTCPMNAGQQTPLKMVKKCSFRPFATPLPYPMTKPPSTQRWRPWNASTRSETPRSQLVPGRFGSY